MLIKTLYQNEDIMIIGGAIGVWAKLADAESAMRKVRPCMNVIAIKCSIFSKDQRKCKLMKLARQCQSMTIIGLLQLINSAPIHFWTTLAVTFMTNFILSFFYIQW